MSTLRKEFIFFISAKLSIGKRVLRLGGKVKHIYRFGENYSYRLPVSGTLDLTSLDVLLIITPQL
jgi:hypothetical protein